MLFLRFLFEELMRGRANRLMNRGKSRANRSLHAYIREKVSDANPLKPKLRNNIKRVFVVPERSRSRPRNVGSMRLPPGGPKLKQSAREVR